MNYFRSISKFTQENAKSLALGTIGIIAIGSLGYATYWLNKQAQINDQTYVMVEDSNDFIDPETLEEFVQ